MLCFLAYQDPKNCPFRPYILDSKVHNSAVADLVNQELMQHISGVQVSALERKFQWTALALEKVSAGTLLRKRSHSEMRHLGLHLPHCKRSL